MSPEDRVSIGLWSELPPGARWTHEGVSRVVGFLVEGAAAGKKYKFHVVVPRGMADTVKEDLRDLEAVEGLDWQVWEPSEADEARFRKAGRGPDVDPNRQLAAFANENVPVEAWVVTFPHFRGSLALAKPKATLFPDAIPYDFPLGWNDNVSWTENGGWPKWRKQATEVMNDSHAVITFSKHVAVRHAGPLCNVTPDKIRVVPLAPPDLAAILPTVENRIQTIDSRRAAADILREYCADEEIDYLRNFPFEEVDFVAAATQDRPTKNLHLTADAVRIIVREKRQSMKLLLTARLHWGAPWTRLPNVVEAHLFNRDLMSMPDLPRKVHAALFHAASVVVHSSFFEGIIGALPFYEANSVGTPALIASGPHVDELLEIEPDIRPFIYDPYDAERLADLILDAASNREDYVNAQQQIFRRVSKHTWSDVASLYAKAALEGVRTNSAESSGAQ